VNPEEYLDRLIERREHCVDVPISVAEDEIAASLAAAKLLTQLQEIEVPHEFSKRLELSIRNHANNLAEQNCRTILAARPRSLAGSQRFPRRHIWVSVFRIAAVLMVVCVGVLTASARSIPGDALYGLKQAENQFALTFASALQSNATLQIDQLRSAIIDLKTVVNDGRDDDTIRLVLANVVGKTSDSREAVATLPAGFEQEAAQRDLASILAEEEQTLRYLLVDVDWPMQLAFTQQLSALGDPVPAVVHVVIRTQSNGTLMITLTGSHFASQVELMINGRPTGMLGQNIPGQLVAVISNSLLSSGANAIGVRNPDGTAAQLVFNLDNRHYHGQPDDNHSRQGTPEPGDGFDN
jgi:hypothetical protein